MFIRETSQTIPSKWRNLDKWLDKWDVLILPCMLGDLWRHQKFISFQYHSLYCNVIEYEAPLYKPHFFGIITSSHFIYFNKLRDESFNNLLRSTVIKMHIWNQDQVYNSSTELQVDTTVANT